MRELTSIVRPIGRVAALGIALAAVLPVVLAAPAAAQPHEWTAVASCRLHGSWLAEVDIGGRFFVQYGAGANASSGPMTVEWISFDPTLFGNFPTVVSLTQGVGAWARHGQTYDYTWMAYGLDPAGLPVYAVRTAGTGEFDGCETIAFDWVLEVFPTPLDPLGDDPVACLSGVGSKVRIPVELVTCP